MKLLITLLALAWPALLHAQVPSDELIARAGESRAKGAADAPVTIIELSDFQCPFCARFALETLPAIDSAYIATGKVRMVFFNFPLPNHGTSWIAAEAAMCAGAQDAFWPMHDRLFAAQAEWSTSARPHAAFVGYAAELGLDPDDFAACTEHDLVATLLSGDLMQAARSGAGATPTFILNGERVLSGALPFSDFQAAIEELLREPD